MSRPDFAFLSGMGLRSETPGELPKEEMQVASFSGQANWIEFYGKAASELRGKGFNSIDLFVVDGKPTEWLHRGDGKAVLVSLYQESMFGQDEPIDLPIHTVNFPKYVSVAVYTWTEPPEIDVRKWMAQQSKKAIKELLDGIESTNRK